MTFRQPFVSTGTLDATYIRKDGANTPTTGELSFNFPLNIDNNNLGAGNGLKLGSLGFITVGADHTTLEVVLSPKAKVTGNFETGGNVTYGGVGLSNSPGREINQSTEATTTNATKIAIITDTLDDDTVYIYNVLMTAMADNNTEFAVYKFSFMVSRVSAGVAVLGDIIYENTQESNSAWDADATVSGNDVLVNIQGEAALTVDWVVSIEKLKITS